MNDVVLRTLVEAFPSEVTRYYQPIMIGRDTESADAGAAAILAGRKTATSSLAADYDTTSPPFPGALSVLVDGRGRPRAILETVRVEPRPFGAIDGPFVEAYGEGDGTLAWFRSTLGPHYREEAAAKGLPFDDETVLLCEWFKVACRL